MMRMRVTLLPRSNALESAGFMNAGADIESEADADIQSWTRQPLASGNRDKGGEED